MARKNRPAKDNRNTKIVQFDDNRAKVRRPLRPTVSSVTALTKAQKLYDESFRSSKMTFGIGPAGTGKTWFATMRAAQALDAGLIDKIIITRPVVEAEEELGFLPGDMDEKYEPYLRPVKDALEEFFGTGHLELLLKRKIIEPRPLAYLRGATLKDCWVIADEMQNATKGQLKLLLTRFGQNAKFIINGDPSQCDLERGKSGLMDAVSRLSHIPDVGTVHFTREDVVREGLVQEILEAYEDNI